MKNVFNLAASEEIKLIKGGDVILLRDRCAAVVTLTETHFRCYEYSFAVENIKCASLTNQDLNHVCRSQLRVESSQ